MRRQITRAPQARREIMQVADYFAEKSGYNISEKFLRAVDKMFWQIADMPGIGTLRDYDNPKFAGMRMLPIQKFSKYLIFYRTTETTIEILRVLHGARDLQAIFGPDEGDE